MHRQIQPSEEHSNDFHRNIFLLSEDFIAEGKFPRLALARQRPHIVGAECKVTPPETRGPETHPFWGGSFPGLTGCADGFGSTAIKNTIVGSTAIKKHVFGISRPLSHKIHVFAEHCKSFSGSWPRGRKWPLQVKTTYLGSTASHRLVVGFPGWLTR